MGHASMPVAMGMDEVGPQQQVVIRQDLGWCADSCHPSFFEHDHTIGDIFKDFDLMSRSYHRPSSDAPPALNEIDKLTLAAWIEH